VYRLIAALVFRQPQVSLLAERVRAEDLPLADGTRGDCRPANDRRTVRILVVQPTN
jgi:hypothetical protein